MVTSSDAMIVSMAEVQKVTLNDTQKIAADISGDSLVTSTDAMGIAMYEVGRITSFPVENQ